MLVRVTLGYLAPSPRDSASDCHPTHGRIRANPEGDVCRNQRLQIAELPLALPPSPCLLTSFLIHSFFFFFFWYMQPSHVIKDPLPALPTDYHYLGEWAPRRLPASDNMCAGKIVQVAQSERGGRWRQDEVAQLLIWSPLNLKIMLRKEVQIVHLRVIGVST